jgi:hypothetical protein
VANTVDLVPSVVAVLVTFADDLGEAAALVAFAVVGPAYSAVALGELAVDLASSVAALREFAAQVAFVVVGLVKSAVLGELAAQASIAVGRAYFFVALGELAAQM